MVYKDRTREFFECAKSISSKSLPAAPRTSHSAFFVAAKQISRDIYATHEKLEKLAKLASSTSLFNDPVHDIQELTYMIKKDISNLNRKLEGVKGLASNNNKQSQANSENVVSSLTVKLQDTTKEFRKVLATRSENYKKQQDSRKQFTGTHHMNTKKRDAQSALYNPEIENESNTEQAQGQLMITNPQRYDGQARLDAIQDIERTMTELNKIMVDISVMVEEQQVVMERIDHNVNDSLQHVERAQNQLLKVLQNVSSDRGLILKMFFILVVFCIVFFAFFV